jgi:hypothetical protein
MTITLDIRPETKEELARQAAARGLGVGAYAASLLEEAAHAHAQPEAIGSLARVLARTETQTHRLVISGRALAHRQSSHHSKGSVECVRKGCAAVGYPQENPSPYLEALLRNSSAGNGCGLLPTPASRRKPSALAVGSRCFVCRWKLGNRGLLFSPFH